MTASFTIAQIPVTNGLYARFQHSTQAHVPVTWGGVFPESLAQHPVVDVSWNEAQALCVWLQQETGQQWRLPTESEWEKAARGTDARVFPWGNDFDPQRCNVKESGNGQTTAGDAYQSGASPYGVLDLAGNVWEWTQSLQAPYPYRADDGRNGTDGRVSRRVPRFLQRLLRNEPEHALPAVEVRRIIRGGCYANPEGFARSACRLRLSPERRTPFLGIRLALDL
jgi:formylglycine-generating enzyme required for sulfatase activity